MSPNPFDYLAIQNTIARYCIALDDKNFDLLNDVFTPDVDAKYFLGHFKDVVTLAKAIQKRLQPVKTQHALTTQMVVVSEDGSTAEASTYFTGVHFGQGKWEGKETTAWGKYVDSLVLIEGKSALPGASGQWLIRKRELVVFGRLGEHGVMDGE